MKLDVIEVLASETLSSLARGKWIEAADSVITKVSEVSSLARGKWIEALGELYMTAGMSVFPRKREVD